MRCKGLQAAIEFLQSESVELEAYALELREPSDGRLSAHPVDKIKAKGVYERAQQAKRYAQQLSLITVECTDAESLQHKD